VENFCLVPTAAGPDLKYVALSYVWGNTKSLQTLLSIVEKLQIHNSLLAEEYASQIPNTIKDAIYVTKQLEEVVPNSFRPHSFSVESIPSARNQD
jgi:hypothetical protein